MSFDLYTKFGPYITLASIEVRERTLGSLGSSYGYGDMKGRGKVGKHDYIIVTVIDRGHRKFRFVAEKMRKRTLCAGMPSHIHMVPLREFLLAAPASRSRYYWGLGEQTVYTTELTRILAFTGHNYSVMSDNCWSYATRTAEAVLGLCLHHSQGTRNFVAARGCQEALQLLDTVKRPLPRDILRLAYKPLSSKNHETLSRIGHSVLRRLGD